MHAQHLSGVGHYVRSLEIARALRYRGHEVWITDGGKPVPHRPVEGLVIHELPRLVRANGKLVSLDRDMCSTDVMAYRQAQLRQTILELQPDRVVIEHYPFSKWELGEEIRSLVNAARAVNRSVRVICSVRDIPRQTSHETCSQGVYEKEVLQRLHDEFDAMMVHGEERLSSLDEHFSAVSEIRLPWAHTGIVAEKLVLPLNDKPILDATGGRPYLLVSAGGGEDRAGLLEVCMAAWRILQEQGELAGWRLVLCAGLTDQNPPEGFAASTLNNTILWRPFSADFLAWMRQAELAIVCAGYNTCANLLETRCRALLVPNPAMSDQRFRAQLLGDSGLAFALDSANLTAVNMTRAILQALESPKPSHDISLDGARRAAAFVETLSSGANVSES